jgi:exoribonuclease R
MTTRAVGVLELASKYRYGLTAHGVPLYLFRPYDEALPEFIVGSKSRDTSHNQIALVDIPAEALHAPPPPPAKPRAALVRLVGFVGDPAAEREGLLLHYCPVRHKSAITAPEVTDATDTTRTLELSAATGWITFHVDPVGCRDIDDAIAYHPATDTFAITIADAAAAVPAGSPLDETACEIGSTFYNLEGRAVIPMLPPAISEDAASLLPGQRRRGLSLVMEPGKPDRFALSWITVDHSFHYDNFIGSDVARQLRITGEHDAHICIEKYMVHYNRAAAEFLQAHNAGILRIQSAATAEKIYSWSWPPDMAYLAKEAALYAPATDTTGHSGLGLASYTHATSPLRRYADLINQRAIKALLAVTTPPPPPVDPTAIDALNARAKANKRWTRDLTFLTHVTPGRVHEVEIVWADPASRRAWVPAWGRLLRVRHDPPADAESGSAGRIQIFCDPTKRNWKRRILTAPCGPASPSNHPAPAATPASL